MRFTLKCGLVIMTSTDGSGTILKPLPREPRDKNFNSAMDAIESVVLAHACAGVDIGSAAYEDGLSTALEALANNLDE